MYLFQQVKEQVQRLNPNRYSKRTDYWDEESGTNKLGMSDAEAFFSLEQVRKRLSTSKFSNYERDKKYNIYWTRNGQDDWTRSSFVSVEQSDRIFGQSWEKS